MQILYNIGLGCFLFISGGIAGSTIFPETKSIFIIGGLLIAVVGLMVFNLLFSMMNTST